MNAHVKILILNWNGCKLTLDCLQSLSQIKYDNYSIMVIDNGSTDGSIESIHKKYPGVEILAIQENVGFGSAYNFAFEHLKQVEVDFQWILNNDTTVQADAITHFLNAVEIHGEDHLYGPLIPYMDQPERIWYAGGEVDLPFGQLSHTGIRSRVSSVENTIIETGFITGCSIFSTKETFVRLGGFDRSFNMYSEDVDLCLRARGQQIKSYVVPEAIVFHKVSASMGGELSYQKLKRKITSVYRLMDKHCSGIQLVFGFPLFLIRFAFSWIWSLLRF